MKDLLTFIYGLLLIGIGTWCAVKHLDFLSLWDYFWVGVGAVNIIFGFLKLDKSTK